jgi:DNA-binding FadR family transcriptional regulator
MTSMPEKVAAGARSAPSMRSRRDGGRRAGSRAQVEEVLPLADSPAARLAARIHRGEVLPGARLPSERKLALELGVSRPALREALQALQVAGLVQVRYKSGWYVPEHRSDASGLGLARWMQLQPVSEVVMVRRVLEPDAIRAVPAVRVAELARECAEIMTAMRRALKDGDNQRATDLHAQFHLALIQYAPSRVAHTLLASMIEVSSGAQRQLFATPRANLETLKRHDAILAPLLAGNVEATAVHAAEHLTPAFTYRVREVSPGARRNGQGPSPADERAR